VLSHLSAIHLQTVKHVTIPTQSAQSRVSNPLTKCWRMLAIPRQSAQSRVSTHVQNAKAYY